MTNKTIATVLHLELSSKRGEIHVARGEGTNALPPPSLNAPQHYAEHSTEKSLPQVQLHHMRHYGEYEHKLRLEAMSYT